MRQNCFVAALLLCAFCASCQQAWAQPNAIEREVKAMPGRDLRIGVYVNIRTDCTSGPLPAIRLAAAPTHGTVGVKRAMFKATNLKRCLATEVPAFVAFYRAALGYSGADSFDLEISFSGGRKELQHFRVSVANGAGDAGGI